MLTNQRSAGVIRQIRLNCRTGYSDSILKNVRHSTARLAIIDGTARGYSLLSLKVQKVLT